MTEESKRKANLLGIGAKSRHIFLCADQSVPLCCSAEEGLAAWNQLKRTVADLENSGEVQVFRTKTNCLRICSDGPIAVVYPEGAWYRNCHPANIERIADEHLRQGRIVEDLLITLAPLPRSKEGD